MSGIKNLLGRILDMYKNGYSVKRISNKLDVSVEEVELVIHEFFDE